MAWAGGILLLVCVTLGQLWIMAIPPAVAGVSLYKAWSLSRHEGRPPRMLVNSFLFFGVGVLLPMGLVIYPGHTQLHLFVSGLLGLASR
jgi:hypothetical protein